MLAAAILLSMALTGYLALDRAPSAPSPDLDPGLEAILRRARRMRAATDIHRGSVLKLRYPRNDTRRVDSSDMPG